jgi:hypothetical protein
MKQAPIRTLLVTVLSIWLTTSAWAGYDEGWAAYKRGDYTTALEELLLPANAGDARAQFLLGFMYRHGKGVPKDIAEGLRWLRMAMDANEHSLPGFPLSSDDLTQCDSWGVAQTRASIDGVVMSNNPEVDAKLAMKSGENLLVGIYGGWTIQFPGVFCSRHPVEVLYWYGSFSDTPSECEDRAWEDFSEYATLYNRTIYSSPGFPYRANCTID